MKIIVKISLAIGSVALCLGALSFFKKPKQEGEITIGILQFASHPALDAAREGFKKELAKELGKPLSFIEKNAQGSVAQAHLIAQSFHADADINAMLAIATPAGQAIAAVEKERPIFITAVTDPTEAGLTGPNICGSTDMIDASQEVALLIKLVPHAKKIALLFNQSEINATIVASQLEHLLEKAHLTVIKIAVSQEADLIVGVQQAAQSADVIMTPIDNSVANAIAIIARKARDAGTPLIVSDPTLVPQGALAAAGVSYEKVGKHAAISALKVLRHGKEPTKVGFAQTPTTHIAIHKTVLHELGLTLPNGLTNAEIIS